MITQDQCTVKERNGQLVLALNSEFLLPENAPVRLTSAQLEELDYEKLYRALYYRVVVFRTPLQGAVLHCKGCCGLVYRAYRKTVQNRLQPQSFTGLLIS